MREGTTLQDYGTAGNSQAQGTDVCIIPTPGPGRYQIWGTCRHTLADGLRLLVGAATIVEITNSPNVAQDFGPIIVDILNSTDNIILELFAATGASDTASGTLYAQKINQ